METLQNLFGRCKVVEIECLACSKTIKPPNFIDTDNYDGQLVCQECKSILHVKFVKGKVQKYKVVENKTKGFDFTDLAMKIEKERRQQENKVDDNSQ
jgi:DNA-directed RNA polymerase subunit RPC12/RpoP